MSFFDNLNTYTKSSRKEAIQCGELNLNMYGIMETMETKHSWAKCKYLNFCTWSRNSYFITQTPKVVSIYQSIFHFVEKSIDPAAMATTTSMWFRFQGFETPPTISQWLILSSSIDLSNVEISKDNRLLGENSKKDTTKERPHSLHTFDLQTLTASHRCVSTSSSALLAASRQYWCV